jgi:hypothetical protein
MSLEKVILNQSNKVSNALETLAAIRKYSNDKMSHGLGRVDLYVEDVEGDWLEEWSDPEEYEEVDFHKLANTGEMAQTIPNKYSSQEIKNSIDVNTP